LLLHKKQIYFYLPLITLTVLGIILYSPQISSVYIPVLSDLSFFDRTSLFAAFAFAAFAAIEGFSSYDRSCFETRRYQIEDLRNELEKAYGPLYSILHQASASCQEKSAFRLVREDQRRIDEIMSAYPFMFPVEINNLWQDKIRDLCSKPSEPDSEVAQCTIMEPYTELRELVGREYSYRLKTYHALINK
jgi:hypothetical protein